MADVGQDKNASEDGQARKTRKPWIIPRVSEIPIEETGESPTADPPRS